MPIVRIPLGPARRAAAILEVRKLSDDATVYMLSLSMMAMGLAVPEDHPLADVTQKKIVGLSEALVSGRLPLEDGEFRTHVQPIVEHLFALMPVGLH